MDGELGHVQTFLNARQALSPSLPLHALVINATHAPELPGLSETECSVGAIDNQQVRLSLLDRVVEQWFHAHPVRA